MGKRVLVCSVPCWNKKTGSDTFSSLMQGYDINDIANLYIREDVPDSPVCHNYFRISENAVIKSILKRNTKTGKHIVIDNCTEPDESNEDNAVATANRYRKYRKKRSYAKLIAREILWKLGKWKTKELDDFLDEFKPDIVFFAMEGYIHFNRITRYILKKTNAKGIGYFWDDNFTYKQSSGLGFDIYRFFQRKSLKKLAKCSTDFFAISPKTKKEADEFFHINCEILTKPIDFRGVEFRTYSMSYPIKMIYTGNLFIGRYDTIKLIGKALDEINKEKVNMELYVYTTTELEDTGDLSKYVHILGAIPQTEIAKVQSEADVLLFAEALSGKNSKTARLSFSTKLTDYFKSGKCILAVGNKEVAPMEYLIEEDAALVAYDYDSLVQSLSRIVENSFLVNEYAKKAFDLGMKNHNKKMIQKKLFAKFN